METSQRNKIVAFVAKAKKMKTHKDKDYFVFRITIPKKEAEVLNLNEEDYLQLYVRKASWFHMINWEETQDTFALLPEDLKSEIRKSQIPVPVAPKIELLSSKKGTVFQISKNYFSSISPSGEAEHAEPV